MQLLIVVLMLNLHLKTKHKTKEYRLNLVEMWARLMWASWFACSPESKSVSSSSLCFLLVLLTFNRFTINMLMYVFMYEHISVSTVFQMCFTLSKPSPLIITVICVQTIIIP